MTDKEDQMSVNAGIQRRLLKLILRKLKAHQQISKKRCFEQYCSSDQNLTIDDKFINKRAPLFIHQTMCREEKILIRHNKVVKQLFKKFFKKIFKKIQKQPTERQKEALEVFCKKCVLKNFANFTGKRLLWSLFFNKVAGLQPTSF